MGLESELKDSAATANAIFKRDSNGDGGCRRFSTTALGGFDNLGYERAGVYSFTTSITIDNGATNGGIFLGTSGSGNITAILPSAVSWAGQVLEILKVDSGTGTVIADGAGSETINGALTVTLRTQYEGIRVRSDGTNWEIISYFNGCLGSLQTKIPDPGTGTAIPVTQSGYVDIVTGASGETNTIAAPSFRGQQLSLSHKTDGGGDRVITVATFINQTGNNTITMNDAGDSILLLAIQSGSNLRWRVVYNDGCTLSTV